MDATHDHAYDVHPVLCGAAALVRAMVHGRTHEVGEEEEVCHVHLHAADTIGKLIDGGE